MSHAILSSRFAIALAGTLLASCSRDTSVPLPPITIDNAGTRLAVAADGLSITLCRDVDTLLTFPADAFQLGTLDALSDTASYDPYWLEYAAGGAIPEPPADLTWRKVVSATVTGDGTHTTVALSFDGGIGATLALAEDAPGRFEATLTPIVRPDGPQIAYMRVRARASATEGFYGMGELEDSVEQRGKLRPMQMEVDADIESADNEAHVPIPLLVGTRGWGLFVESRRVGLFDIARKEPDLVEITYGTAEQSGNGLRFHLFSAANPLDVTKLYYDVTGYPRLPAPWALGPWIWRNESKDQAEVLDDVAKIRDLDLATTAIWLDRPYATAVNSFDFDPKKYTDPVALIGAVHAAGLRLALWSTPYLEKSAEPLRTVAASNGYFVPVSSLPLNPWGTPIDFTNRAAYAFWLGLIRRYTDLGIEGFKLDYGEDVVPALQKGRNVWRFSDGSDERTMQYDYTLLYHQVYAEALGDKGSFLLGRAGRWGDQKNVSVIWPGDMDATFTKHGERFTNRAGETIVGVGGLPATVVMGLSLGVSGFPFFGADTGGYRHSPPDKELYIRWFEQTALSTVMQVGDGSSTPAWVFTAENGRDQEALDLYRTYTRLHLRLFPYEWTYAQRIAQDGRPIQRPLGLAFPSLGVHPSDEYLFGDDLLVAPVLERGATTRRLVLPPGDWIDWWDGHVYSGGERGGVEVIAPAPLGKLPLFLRAGGVVPLLRPTIDALAETTTPYAVDSFATAPGVLYVRMSLRSGKKSSFTAYDGASFDAPPTADTIDVRDGSVFRSGAVLELLGAAKPAQVERSGVPMSPRADFGELESATEGWWWDPANGGALWIKVPGGGAHVTFR